MRFQELRDVDGIVLAQGLHPAIAVVAAGPAARAAAITAVAPDKGCKVLHPSDIEDELKRAAVTAVEQHESAVQQKKGKVAEAEKALTEASDSALATARETTVATSDLARFDDLASRLAFAEESYESAVRADAEAARSLAAALGELDRILGQRHSASTSLEQARKSRDNRGVPEAVLQQAMNLQAALAKAEADKHESVQQADDTSQAARAASRDALLTLETAHTALCNGMALISSGAPDWGPGVPLPGLVANFRDRLAAAVAATQAAEAHTKGVERAARNRLETERNDLDALEATGPVQLDAQGTIAQWVSSDNFNRDDVVFADDAFARFDPEAVAELVTSLAGRGCQVIYLTEDADVLGWAIGLPHEAGGATTITNSRARKPVLVSD
ncbi:MAG TPA: hypothetical protein VMS00_02240 [Acidimicrobiales bacterium]|nr:hypothetical protein [Acidimicrobiales bacterium]